MVMGLVALVPCLVETIGPFLAYVMWISTPRSLLREARQDIADTSVAREVIKHLCALYKIILCYRYNPDSPPTAPTLFCLICGIIFYYRAHYMVFVLFCVPLSYILGQVCARYAPDAPAMSQQAYDARNVAGCA